MEVITHLHEVEARLLRPHRLLDDLERRIGFRDQLEPDSHHSA
jgi:hypothetical protein